MINQLSDLEVLAATIDGEAEGEPVNGQQAVATTIVNRAAAAKAFKESHGYNHPQFGDGTLRGACMARTQYDCWMPGPDLDRITALDPADPTPAFRACLQIAQAAIDGTLPNAVGTATHYFAQSITAPRWVYGARWKGQVGKHLFWGEVA